MSTPLELSAALTVGTIESVAPTELTVRLDTEAPHSTALNAGSPIPFPRINSYLLVPGHAGAVVGQVTWIGISESQWPKRKGMKDFGLVDLPFPLRRLKVTPIGMLRVRIDPATGEERLELERGVSLFPSVGDPVSLPTAKQLRAVVEVDPTEGPVEIGRSALADDRPIRVHPNKIFGRHLAVLGNTGSGKSCSVAGLVRWTIEAVQANRSKTTDRDKDLAGPPGQRGCRFVILDPNGEYKRAFADAGATVKVFAPPLRGDEEHKLVVPAWLWNSQEWASILQAQPGAQQPLLFEAIRALRAGTSPAAERLPILAQDLRNCREQVGAIAGNLAQAVNSLPARGSTVSVFKAVAASAAEIDTAATSHPELRGKAVELKTLADSLVTTLTVPQYTTAPLTRSHMDSLEAGIEATLASLPASSSAVAVTVDQPRTFPVGALPAMIRLRAIAAPDSRALQHVAFLIERLESRLADGLLAKLINPAESPTLDKWIEQFLGVPDDPSDNIVIVDLSLVPSEITHLTVAVIARVLFEATQRYHKDNREAFPTVLVLEEAHTFIQEGRDDPSQSPTPVQMCRRIFEKIAREGRKFGMGLVLSSQRPSEISPTVLSQCNTFLLHRLVNDRDQELVKKLVPDTLGALLKELSVLPTRHAILLGHASPIPKMVVIRNLPYEHQPTSQDPPIWDVWRGVEPRPVDWAKIAKGWADPAA